MFWDADSISPVQLRSFSSHHFKVSHIFPALYIPGGQKRISDPLNQNYYCKPQGAENLEQSPLQEQTTSTVMRSPAMHSVVIAWSHTN